MEIDWAMLVSLKCIRQEEIKVWQESSGPKQPNETPPPLKKNGRRFGCDESPFGRLTNMDLLHQKNKKNKQLNAAEGKADFEESINMLSANLSAPKTLFLPGNPDLAWEQSESHPRGPELQPAVINNPLPAPTSPHPLPCPPTRTQQPLICSCCLKSRPADLIPRMDVNLK